MKQGAVCWNVACLSDYGKMLIYNVTAGMQRYGTEALHCIIDCNANFELIVPAALLKAMPGTAMLWTTCIRALSYGSC
jgi:hypothetical protein